MLVEKTLIYLTHLWIGSVVLSSTQAEIDQNNQLIFDCLRRNLVRIVNIFCL